MTTSRRGFEGTSGSRIERATILPPDGRGSFTSEIDDDPTDEIVNEEPRDTLVMVFRGLASCLCEKGQTCDGCAPKEDSDGQ